mmetsp:Transcript_19419/g.61813  ORF Transcript_19419/g.61813 Transcript_19419/m.61813 type:complete len:245 (+) Transcript_19419:16-750(+)
MNFWFVAAPFLVDAVLVLREDRLAQGEPEAVPHAALGVDAARLLDDGADGKVGIMRVDEPHGDARVPREGAVHRVLPEHGAVDGVARVGGARAHGVGGVDVLEVHGLALLLEVAHDLLLEVEAHIHVLGVAALVRSAGHADLLHLLLPAALRHDDHGVPVLADEPVEVCEEPSPPLHDERDLGDEAHVHEARGQGRVHGDEPGVTPHELHEAHPVPRRARLHVGRADGLLRRLHGGVEAEGAVD